MKKFVKEYLSKIGEAERLPDTQFNSMFASLDENHDDQISKVEMRQFIEKVRATEIEQVKEAVAQIIHQEEVKELIDEIWAEYDTDKSGQLSKAEIKPFAKEYLTKLGEANRLPEDQFNSLFASLDENNDGQISKAEMKEFIEKIRSTEVQAMKEVIAAKDLIDEIWEKYDKDNSGQLSKAELKQFVKEYLTKVGEADRLPEKQFNAIFASLDENHDDQISKAEMKNFIDKIRATEIEQVVEEMIHKEEVKELIDEIWAKYDKDNSGQLSKAEMKPFVQEYLTKLGEGNRLPEKQFNTIFASLD
jgi:Ca2+-binding EF-hand superfamily protein